MQITQELREYARSKGLSESEAQSSGLTEKSEEFRRSGGELYS
jgi:phosphomethylpyrimidine synthase